MLDRRHLFRLVHLLSLSRKPESPVFLRQSSLTNPLIFTAFRAIFFFSQTKRLSTNSASVYFRVLWSRKAAKIIPKIDEALVHGRSLRILHIMSLRYSQTKIEILFSKKITQFLQPPLYLSQSKGAFVEQKV